MLKYAIFCPVPKKTKPTVKDFRPISILPVIGKVFEQLVLDNMRRNLMACYSPHQHHAYRTLGSTTSALVSIHDHISKLLDEQVTRAVSILCLDLSMVFDGLWFNLLLNFLNDKGLEHGFLVWLQSYLTFRRFRVKAMHTYGPLVEVSSGVPRGSVLGPYLFAAFMGSVHFSEFDVSTFMVQYADDMTLIESVYCNSRDAPLSYITAHLHNAGLLLNATEMKEIPVKEGNDCALASLQFPTASH